LRDKLRGWALTLFLFSANLRLMNFFFKSRKQEPTPEPTVQETRTAREAELHSRRATVELEIELTQEKWRAFRLAHFVWLEGRVRPCGQPMQGEQLRLQDTSYAQALAMLQQEHSKILAELCRLQDEREYEMSQQRKQEAAYGV
jgi:pimeloyl-CoA synthetase